MAARKPHVIKGKDNGIGIRFCPEKNRTLVFNFRRRKTVLSKSLRILFLSMLAAAAAVVPAMGLEITVDDAVLNNATELLNYEAHFTTDADDGTAVTWSLISTTNVTASADATAWLKSAMSGDVFVVYGQLPAYISDEEAEDDPNYYTYTVTAAVSSETASTDPIEITVEQDEDATIAYTEFTAGNITPSGDITSVDRTYSVDITFDEDYYDTEIEFTSLPYWLKATPVTETIDDAETITGYTITHKKSADLYAGETGVVRFDDPNEGGIVNWSVTLIETIVYNPSASFDLTASGDTTVSLVLGTQDTSITLIPSNDIGTVTYASDASWVTVSDSGVVTIAPADASLVSTAAHTVTITATDAARATDNTATVALTITVMPASVFRLNVSSDVSMNLSTQSTMRVTLTPVSADGTVTYGTPTVSPNNGGLTVSMSGNVATLTARTAGTYTVTFTATDTPTGRPARTAQATTTVRVSGITPDSFTLSAPAALTLTLGTQGGNTGTVTLSADGAVSYSSSVSPNNGGLTVSINQSTGVATLTATTAATYTVTFTATNAAGRTAQATTTVTVRGDVIPGTDVQSKDFSLAVTTSTVSLTLGTLGDYTKTVTLTAIDAEGSVSYSSSVSPNNGGLTVSINQSTGAATLTAMTAGTYKVTFTATDSAPGMTDKTASATVTVTVAGGILSPDITSIDITPLSGSSGGCDAGFGVLALALAASLFFRRKRS